MKRLGLITIGQSPRTDLTPDLIPLLEGIEIVERGALDHLSNDEIAALVISEGDEILTSRLRDGTSAVFGREHVLPQIQAAITELERGEQPVDAILLACAGEFPDFVHRTPLLLPDDMMVRVVSALAADMTTVGLICPLEEQIDFIISTMRSVAPRVIGAAASPYTDTIEDAVAAGRTLANEGAELLVAFCMGYPEETRAAVHAETGLPVLLVRSVSARLAAEFLQPTS